MPTITLDLPPGFILARAVCSYGYFILEPNRWDARRKAISRPLHTGSGRLIPVTIHQPTARSLRIVTGRALTKSDRAAVTAQVRRMLRLDEDLSSWRRLHPVARRRKFDRLFRSPTLFEDIVKTITGCNVTWPNTMRMNRLLCEHVGRGGFPTPAQLAAVTPAWLKAHCKVGYRAERIVRLARDVHAGRLDLTHFERPDRSTDQVEESLREIHGIGPYAAANLCMLLGRYDRLAIDSETYRHFRQTHRVKTPRTSAGLRRLHRRIDRYYARFAPFQFLAYWFELWTGYEGHAGDAREWQAEVHGPTFTAAKLRHA